MSELKIPEDLKTLYECACDEDALPPIRVVELIERIAKLSADLEQWKTWGIIEIAVRNSSVADYMNHWETRTTKAEADLEAAQREREEFERKGKELCSAYGNSLIEIHDLKRALRDLYNALEPVEDEDWIKYRKALATARAALTTPDSVCKKTCSHSPTYECGTYCTSYRNENTPDSGREKAARGFSERLDRDASTPEGAQRKR